MSMFRTYTDLQRLPKDNTQIQFNLFSCDICEEGEWMSETEVEIHKKNTHFTEIFYRDSIKIKHGNVCTVCVKQHTTTKSLYEHIKTEHLLSSSQAERVEREIYICEVCSHLFFNKQLLQIHIVQKHSSSTSRKCIISCPVCLKSLKKPTLWQHLEQHKISSVATCPICLEKCPNRTDLRIHINRHRKHYFCVMCNYATKKEENFYDHIKNHTKNGIGTDKRIKKYFVPTSRSKRLRFTVSNIIKGLMLPNNIRICIVCRHICTSLGQMRRHLMYDHVFLDDVKKNIYICACGQNFFNKVMLKQHIFREKDGHRALEEIKDIAADVSDLQPLSEDSETIIKIKSESYEVAKEDIEITEINL